MNVVGLISGGKDSCFNMMHCVANGHSITSLANLHPPAKEQDEMDSWMYQTVGHDIIDLYSEAMKLPLYRQAIRGKNVQQNLHYNQAQGDETEDLYQLLRKVLDAQPDTQAISVGAIASNYQRLRVENVASRLGLTVLSYLWERDQSTLLHEMIENGLHAILIKVACVGLNEKHLGQSLAQIEPRMASLKQKYQVHPCGEGGEYESIVLDCPLFVKKLCITDPQVVKLEGDTAYLKLKASVSEKEQYSDDWITNLQSAAGLDEPFATLLMTLRSSNSNGQEQTSINQVQKALPTKPQGPQTSFSGSIKCTNYTQTDRSPQLSNLINDDNDQILFCFLILRDMSDFASINTDYAKLWTTAHPPARVCISSPQPPGVKYILYTFAIAKSRQALDADAQDRTGKRLWVQSRSYWAPSNIGPYSQLTLQDGIFFSSGQIGLVPSSMLLASTVQEEIAWSLQSLYRVCKVHDTQDYDGVLLCYIVSRTWRDHVAAAWDAVRAECMTGSVKMLVIELLEGSQLPRAANVEWQFIAAAPASHARINTIDQSHNGTALIGFATHGQELSDQVSALPVQSILFDGTEVTYAGITFDTSAT